MGGRGVVLNEVVMWIGGHQGWSCKKGRGLKMKFTVEDEMSWRMLVERK